MPVICPMCRTQLAEGSQFCHQCGLPLTGESPMIPRHAKPPVGIRVLLVLSWLTCVVGTLLIPTVDVETIMGSGPILAGLGIITCTAGAFARHWRACFVGLLHVSFCLFIFLLIVGLGWSPDQAHHRVLTIASVYALAVIPLSIWAWFGPSRQRSPWFCLQCGYFLRGLTEARCPECGTPFDPKLLSGPNPADRT